MSDRKVPAWLGELEEEDWQFLKRFVLLSGSLKDIAAEYGISYPTVRLRLDRLIEKVRVLDDADRKDPFRLRIQLLAASGEIGFATAKTILREYDAAQRKGGSR